MLGPESKPSTLGTRERGRFVTWNTQKISAVDRRADAAAETNADGLHRDSRRGLEICYRKLQRFVVKE